MWTCGWGDLKNSPVNSGFYFKDIVLWSENVMWPCHMSKNDESSPWWFITIKNVHLHEHVNGYGNDTLTVQGKTQKLHISF